MLTMPKKPGTPADRRDDKAPGGIPSLISADVEISGTFVAQGEVQFDGKIEGDLHAGGVVIGEGAIVKGEVIADRVRVQGTVEGVIRAGHVELAATAVVKGDVMHTALSVKDGAKLDGKVCCVENAGRTARKPGLPAAEIKAELAELKERTRARDTGPAATVAPAKKAAKAA